jgi:TonB family protein
MQVSPDPTFSWEQRRVRLGQLTCILSILIGEDGKAGDISIVTPVGMGLDDEAVRALHDWRFTPANREGKPVSTHARVFFLVSPPNTVPTLSSII